MSSVPIDVAIPHLAGLGYAGLELAVTARHTTDVAKLDTKEVSRIARLLRDYRLELPSIAAHSSLLGAGAEHQLVVKRLRTACNVAAELAGDQEPAAVITTMGGTPDRWPGVKQQLTERISALAEYAATRGVTIGLEPHVGEAVETPAQAVELLDAIGLANVKVNFDISQYEVSGIPMDQSIPLLASRAVHAHVKDQRGRVPDYEFLVPGEGDFDYVRYLRSMQRHRYRGFVTVEISVMVEGRPDYDPLLVAAQAYTTLDAAFRASGVERT
jgi:inosose dehydratase